MPVTVSENRDSTSARHPPRGVPRRFGLGMLFVWTTVFSVALVGANALDTPWPVVLVLSLFFVLVAIGQWYFGEGHRARAASVVLGAVYFPPLMLIALAIDSSLLRMVWASWLWVGLGLVLTVSVCGAMGYLTGTLVAGVFLVAYWIDRAIARWRGVEGASDELAALDSGGMENLIDHPTGTG